MCLILSDQNQAFHPFYIFQVASLILWSMDEYYYYAVCIFLISVFSIGTTVLETRSVCSRPDQHWYPGTNWRVDHASPTRDLAVRVRRPCAQKWILYVDSLFPPALLPLIVESMLTSVILGRSVSSQDLVPGDVFEFSDPSLNQVPCDCILLSGDCIVNESMLTGLYCWHYGSSKKKC